VNDKNLASSYRRMFRIITANMENWKGSIVLCADSKEMHGLTNDAQVLRAVMRMGRVKRAVEFMAGGPTVVKMHDNADDNGKSVVLRNAGYYVNIGA